MNFDPETIEDDLDKEISKIKVDVQTKRIFGDFDKSKGSPNVQMVRVQTKEDLFKMKKRIGWYEGQLIYVMEIQSCFMYSNGGFIQLSC